MNSPDRLAFIQWLQTSLPHGAVECRSPGLETLMLCLREPSLHSFTPAVCQCSATIFTNPSLEGRPICRSCFIMGIDEDVQEITE